MSPKQDKGDAHAIFSAGSLADVPDSRPAATSVPIHPDLAARWSPRAFDPEAAITADQLTALLEAARWAASWGHRQPVRFVVGTRHGAESAPHVRGETFTTLAGLLKRGNSYANAASALVLVCTDEGEDERTALYAAVDAGAAIAQLTVEAVSRGLVVHPMAGFDVDGARAAFGIPEGVRPLAVVAVGTLGEPADEAIAERDSRPRERLPLEQIAFSGRWGIPLS